MDNSFLSRPKLSPICFKMTIYETLWGSGGTRFVSLVLGESSTFSISSTLPPSSDYAFNFSHLRRRKSVVIVGFTVWGRATLMAGCTPRYCSSLDFLTAATLWRLCRLIALEQLRFSVLTERLIAAVLGRFCMKVLSSLVELRKREFLLLCLLFREMTMEASSYCFETVGFPIKNCVVVLGIYEVSS